MEARALLSVSWLLIYEVGLGLLPRPCLIQEIQPRIRSDGDPGSGTLPCHSRNSSERPLFPQYDWETEAQLGRLTWVPIRGA